MKKTIIVAAIFTLCISFVTSVPAGPKSERIIRNPSESLYGEIPLDLEEDLVLGSDNDERYLFYRVWDIKTDDQNNIFVLDSGATRIQKYDKNGQYVQTIGRQGQGPGEFQRPIELTIDKKGNLYVCDMAKIHMFDPEGKFVKTTKIPFFYMSFAADGEGHFIVTGRVTAEGSQNLGVMILDSDGGILKKIAEFPGLPVHETGMTVSHDYSPQIRFAALASEGIVYGYNLVNKIYIADWSGKNIITIEKNEPPHAIGQKEKRKIIDDLTKNLTKAGLGWSNSMVEKMANLPNHRPYFDRIRVDDKGRLYIRRRKSVLDESEDSTFDIFGNDGYYLYTATLPFTPTCIKDGFLYHSSYEEETGQAKVIRYRIKNWNRLKSAVN
jgi:hypothetical protein